MNNESDTLFKTTTIKLDYNSTRNNPAKIFNSMAKVIESFYILDECLISVFQGSIVVKYEIQSVEMGSIKTTIKTILELIDDDALKELNVKGIIGSFLVKSKHYLLNFRSLNYRTNP